MRPKVRSQSMGRVKGLLMGRVGIMLGPEFDTCCQPGNGVTFCIKSNCPRKIFPNPQMSLFEISGPLQQGSASLIFSCKFCPELTLGNQVVLSSLVSIALKCLWVHLHGDGGFQRHGACVSVLQLLPASTYNSQGISRKLLQHKLI